MLMTTITAAIGSCRWTWIVAAWLVLSAASAAAPSAAAAAPMVTVSPSVIQVSSAGEFQVSLMVNAEVGDLSCFALSLDFDSSLFEFVGATEGDLYTSSGLQSTFFVDTDPEGRPRLAGCVLGFQTSVQGPGEIAVVTFRPVVTASAALEMTEITLRDNDRAIIPDVEHIGGSVLIGGTATSPIGSSLSASMSLLAEPNPSNGRVWLRLQASGDLDGSAGAHLVLYDAAGRQIREIRISSFTAGLGWDGRDSAGRSAAAGVYFGVLRLSDGRVATGKVLRIN